MAEERRLVTVLFADVVGSTALGETMDPEDLRGLLARFYAIASDVMTEHGGTLEKFIGDAAMAIFGLPHAHDDDARRALDAALALRDRLRGEAGLGEQLPIRVGLNTGEVIASRDRERNDFLVTGDPVNVAARLQQAAEPWQILASARTAIADGGAHDFGPATELELKGKAAGVEARVLLGHASSVTAPRRTPLVGRAADLAQLEMVAGRAFTERRPYMVSLLAPAGTGKSRLVDEFVDRLPGIAADAQVAVAQCLPYGQRLTYWPMRALLDSIIGLPADKSPEQTRDAIRTWLIDAGAERPAESADLLAATIGASDADVQDRAPLFLAWREVVELAAARRPLVLLVEDLHWSSDSLLDLIEYILQPRSDSAILMLALARPELLERRPTWGGGRRNHVSIALEPLDEESIGALVRGLLEGAAPELVRLVADAVGGETPSTPARSSARCWSTDWTSATPPPSPRRRPGCQALSEATVLARLDSLAPHARRVLQLGSVFGRSFSTDGVASIEGERDDHAAAVEELIERAAAAPQRPRRADVPAHHHPRRRVRDADALRARDAPRGCRPLARAARDRSRRRARRARRLPFPGGRGPVRGARHHRRGHPGERGSMARSCCGCRCWSARGRRSERRPAGGHRARQRGGHRRGCGGGSVRSWGSGDVSVQAFSRAWQLGREHGLPPDFTLEFLGRHLMVVLRFTASVGQQPSERGDRGAHRARGVVGTRCGRAGGRAPSGLRWASSHSGFARPPSAR